MSSLLILLASVVFLLLFLILRVQFASYMAWPLVQATIFALALFSAISSSFFEDATIATGKIWTGAIYGAVFEIIRSVAILVGALMTHDLMAVFGVHVLIQTIRTLLGYGIGTRFGLVSMKWDLPAFRSVWQYAFPVSLAWVFGVIATYSDQMILSKYIPPAEFAFYAVGCFSVPPLIMLEYSVTRVLIPQLSNAFSRQSFAEAADLYKKAVDELGYFLFPATVGLIVFATPIVDMLFTKQYEPAVGYMQLFALTYALYSIPSDAVARARGESKWILWSFVFFSILALVLCWGLIRALGPYGGVLGILLMRGSLKAYSIYYMKKTTPWALTDFLPLASWGRSISISILLGVASVAVRRFFPSDLIWFLSCGSIFVLFYFPATMLWARLRGETAPATVLYKISRRFLGQWI
jgi:O-antigen/teichoic acid export membrane protein